VFSNSFQEEGNASLHNLHPTIPSDQIQPFPFLYLPIALATPSYPQNPADIPRRSCAKLPHTQNATRIVSLLNSKRRTLAFDRCRVGVDRVRLGSGEIRAICRQCQQSAVD
jgi:hypothetical protein